MGRTDTAPVTDDPPRVLDALACEGCGYILRGLALDARCPECSVPIAQSLHDDRLADIPITRLARLRLAMRAAELGSLAILVGMATQLTISPLVSLIVGLGVTPDVLRQLGVGLRVSGQFAMLAGLATIATAAVLLSHLGPRDAGRPDQVRLARIIRGGMLAGGFLLGQAMVIPLLGGPGGRAGSTIAMAVQLGAVGGLICLAAAWWGLLHRIAWLDVRSGEGGGIVDLAGLARGLKSVAVAVCSLFAVRIILIGSGIGPAWVPGVLRGIGILVALATILIIIGTAGASIALRKRMDLLLAMRPELDQMGSDAPSITERDHP